MSQRTGVGVRVSRVLVGLGCLGGAWSLPPAAAAESPAQRWVATWATAQQLTTSETPPWLSKPPPQATAAQSTGKRPPSQPSPIAPIPERIDNQTVRMVARVSIGGRQLRIQLSNAQGVAAVAIGAARVACGIRSNSGESIRPGSDRVITVGGSQAFTIEPGALIVSDPVDLPVPALSDVVVSLYVPHNTSPLTVHSVGLHTTYIGDGDTTAGASLTGASENRSYFWLTGIDVLAPSKAAALVTFGDSITDGFATTPDTDRAWPTVLARRLLDNESTGMVSVANVGISGNRLLHDGAGTNALARFDRDVLARPGVRWVLLLEGINDISFAALPGIPADERVTRDDLVEGYRKFIEKAHVQGLKIIGATLLPWEGVWTFNETAEALRQEINRWILTCGLFDQVIDFDAAMRDPDHPRRLLPRFDSGDHVHPNDAGNDAMARAIDVVSLSK